MAIKSLRSKSIKFKLYPIRGALNELSHFGGLVPRLTKRRSLSFFIPLSLPPSASEKGTNEFIFI